jgi:hypothetical protein
MKTDKLEKFIIKNRDQFDDLEPGPGTWQKIEQNQTKTVDLNWTRILVRAAAIVVIFVSSYIFFDHVTKDNVEPMLTETEVSNPEDIRTYQELMEAEYYYTSMIEQRKEEFIQLSANNAPLRKEITVELKELDKIFRELKEDLKDNADNEEVVVAMIQNYRLKLEILEEILLQLKPANENIKDYENESINM